MKFFFKKCALLAGLALLTFIMQRVGFFHPFESAFLDVFLLQKEHTRAKHVFLVDITDADYQSVFGGKSPLDPATLGRLVEAARSFHPRAIGIDVDTSDPAFAPVAAKAATWTNVFWARTGRPDLSPEDASIGQLVRQVLTQERRPLVLDDFLGGAPQDCPYGLAVFPTDRDGVIRAHARVLPVLEENGAHVERASLPLILIRAYDSAAGSRLASEGGEMVMNLPGTRYQFDGYAASLVLELFDRASTGGPPSRLLDPYRDRIWIIGGSYAAGRDTHLTPVGPMSGFTLLAGAVESELQGSGIRHTGEGWMIVTDLLLGIAMMVMGHYLSARKFMLASLVFIPAIALVASFLLFSTLSYWASFVPMLAGVFIDYVRHGVAEHG